METVLKNFLEITAILIDMPCHCLSPRLRVPLQDAKIIVNCQSNSTEVAFESYDRNNYTRKQPVWWHGFQCSGGGRAGCCWHHCPPMAHQTKVAPTTLLCSFIRRT